MREYYIMIARCAMLPVDRVDGHEPKLDPHKTGVFCRSADALDRLSLALIGTASGRTLRVR